MIDRWRQQLVINKKSGLLYKAPVLNSQPITKSPRHFQNAGDLITRKRLNQNGYGATAGAAYGVATAALKFSGPLAVVSVNVAPLMV